MQRVYVVSHVARLNVTTTNLDSYQTTVISQGLFLATDRQKDARKTMMMMKMMVIRKKKTHDFIYKGPCSSIKS